ncbi:MAG: [FeFe] hydrogenase H-cluster radical SAM maturase HydE [Ignavibacteria bacterium]|nr:[FeFe] hydrogenase H-cluster radical SAM maturase HydE [Ignavibacteria bacterium]
MVLLKEILEKTELTQADLISLLSCELPDEIEQIRAKAYEIMKSEVGEKVYLRGLIEFSNICVNDCYYCGIRRSNKSIQRYTLQYDEILDCAMFAFRNGYGSIVLQSGEQRTKKFIDFLCRIISEIKAKTISDSLPNGLGITLCIGEQTYASYKRLFEAGAHRYLLRIETSNPELFRMIHPRDISFENRLECLYSLKDIGFQVGTGVMIGLPGQSLEDLANDILFFKEIDADMIGMGPYIVHKETPFANFEDYFQKNKRDIYKLSLKMIAVVRIFLRDVNIASTTALQALYPFGREEGLRFGANVIMPLLTPVSVRKNYVLYEGKPCIDEFTNSCGECIIARIESIGRTVGYNQFGDSKHYHKKDKI